MESPITCPVTAMWCPTWSFSASGFSTARTFWSLSVTITIFAPAARHFLVHASALSLAPLAPHLSSLTHPLTVVVFPMSSNAIAVRANTKQIARQSTNTFLMARFFSFLIFRSRPQAAGYGSNSNRKRGSNSTLPPIVDCRNYTTEELYDCQTFAGRDRQRPYFFAE